jgi:hypothetical protein
VTPNSPDESADLAIERAIGRSTDLALATPGRAPGDTRTVGRALADVATATDVTANPSESNTEEFDLDKMLPKIAEAVWKEFRRRLRSERERARGRL